MSIFVRSASRPSLLALVAAFVLQIAPVDAATSTSSFGVSLTITASCTVSANSLSFGSSGVLAVALDATANISVTCTNSTPYNVGLDTGGGSGATIAVRKMTGGAALMSYAMFSDSSRLLIWGNTSGVDTLAGVGTGATQTLTVYGRVPIQATSAPGTYTDTVGVTIYY
jgi:spore coat protein U-like protein